MSRSNSSKPDAAQASFGAELRRLRKAAGLTQEALARRVGYSRVYVTLVENGHDTPGEEFVRLIGDALDGRSQLNALFEAAARQRQTIRSEIESGLPAELALRDLRVVDDGDQDLVVLEALAADGELLVISMNRREALKKLGVAAALAPISSGFRTTPFAAPSASSGATPIEHLQTMYRSLIDSDDLFGSAYALQGTYDQLRIIEQLCENTRGADRQQLLVLRARFAESLAWLNQDQADYETAWQWTDRALEWSHLAGEPSLTAIVLVRKSQLAGDTGDGAAAIDYANAITNLANANTRLPAVASVCAAHGHALIGDSAASDRAYATARQLIASTELEAGDWGSWLDDSYVDGQQARSLTVTGRHTAAVETFGRAIDNISDGFPRDRGVYLARAARAYFAADERDEAAKLGIEALQTGQMMKSGRIDAELRTLLDEFGPIDTEPVAELRELARTAQLV